MPTTATLTIDAFRTTLALTVGGQKPQRHNLLGDDSRDGDWNRNPVAFFRSAADRRLTELGYTRTAGWEYHSGRDMHTVPITAN